MSWPDRKRSCCISVDSYRRPKHTLVAIFRFRVPSLPVTRWLRVFQMVSVQNRRVSIFSHRLIMERSQNWPVLGSPLSNFRDIHCIDTVKDINRCASVFETSAKNLKGMSKYFSPAWCNLWCFIALSCLCRTIIVPSPSLDVFRFVNWVIDPGQSPWDRRDIATKHHIGNSKSSLNMVWTSEKSMHLDPDINPPTQITLPPGLFSQKTNYPCTEGVVPLVRCGAMDVFSLWCRRSWPASHSQAAVQHGASRVRLFW